MASYGTEAGVAGLSRRYAPTGVFTTTTNPTYATVTSWLAQVSAMLNIALASAGFVTPVTDADATPALDGFVNAMCAEMAFMANKSGIDYNDQFADRGVVPIKSVGNNIKQWVADNTAGLVALGAARTTSDTQRIGYRESDANGAAVDHLFTRDGFGSWGTNK